MSRKQMIAAGIVAGFLVLAVLVLVGINRKVLNQPQIPAWLDFRQPPESVAADLGTLTEAQSWAANRCRPMIACCPDYTAGNRIRREYPATLAESPDSFIRASFDLSGGV